jgi:hypothetical protein
LNNEWNQLEDVVSILSEHLNLRPFMQVQDIYKLLYQGVIGSEHLLESPGSADAARQFEGRLRAEFEMLEPGENEPLFESIHPAGSLQRLNLRPYKARQGDLSRLSAVCLDTARQARGTKAELQAAWKLFERACREGTWPGLSLSDSLAFSDWLNENDFPSVHHSQLYRATYQPAYRLIDAAYNMACLSIVSK